MDCITTIKESLGPSLRDFIGGFCILGYFVIANIWTWYVIPEMIPVKNPYILGLIVLCAIGGLLLGGLVGLVKGALFLPAGIAFINGSFFPIFFICWLIGLLFAFLKTIPFPVADNVGNFLIWSLAGMAILVLAIVVIIDHIYGKKNHGKTEPVSDESDDYSSPTFSGDLWGGRWG